MFVCICNAITERQLKTAISEGSTTLQALQMDLGVAVGCGCCAAGIEAYLGPARPTETIAAAVQAAADFRPVSHPNSSKAAATGTQAFAAAD